MSDDDSHRPPFVQLSWLQFIDRALEAARRMTEAEFRRCDAALEAYSRAEDRRHDDWDAQIKKANEVLDYRLEEMNDFRSQINEERAEYLRREIYEREHAALSERVKTLEIVRGEQAGKAAAYASMVGLVVVSVQVALHFLK